MAERQKLHLQMLYMALTIIEDFFYTTDLDARPNKVIIEEPKQQPLQQMSGMPPDLLMHIDSVRNAGMYEDENMAVFQHLRYQIPLEKLRGILKGVKFENLVTQQTLEDMFPEYQNW
jgi:hypothetical protein